MSPSNRFALCTILLLAAIAEAHFNLQYPPPYNLKECNPPECPGPCPTIFTTGKFKFRNSATNPAAVWQRGQTMDIKYHRNNHEGGFYRRSLVPVEKMYNRKWHKDTAFQYGCWEDGRTPCTGSGAAECGTDKKGNIYQNQMTVPTNIPDGKYVFAMVWFGGIHFERNRAQFSDYYTCSFVEINGGPKTSGWTPTFQPGTSHRKVTQGKCATTSVRVGECGGGPCENNPVMQIVPPEFKDNTTPPSIAASLFPGSSSFDPVTMVDIPASDQLEKEKEDMEMAAATVANDESLIEEEAEQIEAESRSEKPKKKNNELFFEDSSGSWGPRNSPLWWAKRAAWWRERREINLKKALARKEALALRYEMKKN